MSTLNSLDAIHSMMIKMLVNTKDEDVINGILNVLTELEGLIADEMKKQGVTHF